MDNWHQKHYDILEKTHCINWRMVFTPKANKKVSHVIKCKFKTFQLN